MPTFLTILFAATVWWIGTGLVALSVRRKVSTSFSVFCVVAVLVLSAFAIDFSKSLATSQGAFIAFVGAIGVWGAMELTHLLGWLTGPEKQACPHHERGWVRFVRAVNVGLYHDLAIIFVGVCLWGLLWSQANSCAALTFSTLWLMRWSAKLNLYLGVANFDSRMAPPHLQYMASYMRRRALNPLFPVSVVVGALAVWLLLENAWAAPQGFAFGRTSGMLVATLAGLGVLEHLFLMLPLRDSRLWQWAFALEARP